MMLRKALPLSLLAALLAVPDVLVARSAEAAPLKAVVGTASLGGDMYAFGVTLGKITSEKLPELSLTVQTTGGGTENLRLLASRSIEFGMVLGPEAGLAVNGQGAFAGKAEQFKKLRGLFAHPYAGIQIVALEGSGIRAIGDLKGKRFGIGAPGSSGATLFLPALIEAHGINKDNTRLLYLNAGQAVNALKNRQADAIAFLQEPPISHIANLAVTEKIRLVATDPAALAKGIERLAGSYPVEIHKDVYGPSQVNEGPIRTMGAAMIFATHDEIDADLVYRFLSLMWSEIDRYRESGILEKRIQLETALRGMTLPLHPGAERFYREKGLLK